MMPNSYFTNPIVFLIDVLFTLYMGIVALRIIMQWAKWEYHNPLVQFIIKVTQVPVKHLRTFIPPIGKWDTATIVLLFLLAAAKLLFVGLFQAFSVSASSFVFILIAEVFSLFITLFSASIIIQAILSWISPANSYNPVVPLISRMNSPLLRPIRKVVPLVGGIDLSPLVALLGLQIFAMLVLPLLIGHI
jgi:YggT family protein